jgi:hypothetical protein
MDLKVSSKLIIAILLFKLDGAKASTCFHSGFWLLATLYKAQLNSLMELTGSNDEFDTYTESFCDSYQDKLGERYRYIKRLMPSIQTYDYKAFTRTCKDEIKTNANLNIWFDPIVYFPSVQSSDLCDSQWSAFNKIKADASTADDASAYVYASYLNSMIFNLDEQMSVEYDNCINKRVIDDPETWAANHVT